jgi:hypothetical protein
LIPKIRIVESVDWMTLILILALVLFTLGKYLFKSRFYNFIALPFNDKYLTLYNKKGKLLNWFHILLTFFQLLNLALFFYISSRILVENSTGSSTRVFWWVFGFLAVFESVKIILQLFKGYVFNTYNLVSELVYAKLSYFNHASIFMFIANVLLIYVFKDSKAVIYTSIFLFILINCIGLAGLLKTHQKLIINNGFYFILYLCALEIAPLVIIGGYLKG